MTVSALTDPAVTLAEGLQSLVPVALAGLEQMQDGPTGLFSHKALLGPGGELINRGINPLYTAASAVGLLSCAGGPRSPHPASATRALDALLERRNESDPAVLGATLWACVLAGRPEAPRVAERVIAATLPRQASSMQLGLALTGLARWLAGGDGDRNRTGQAARALAAELSSRYVTGAHVFAATSHSAGRHPVLQRITSFASQVYPVLGLCELALATETTPPPEVARVCDFLVQCQGELGQWWWFYSRRAPRVIEGYPVYSVHQDAMAPMALLPATRLGLGDYRRSLLTGLRWINGHNELGRSLVDRRAGLIHRAIQRRGADPDGVAGWSRRQRAAVSLAALTNQARTAPRELEVLAECRSYHLGWLLVAAAMARDLG
jgi:hypothetical protein